MASADVIRQADSVIRSVAPELTDSQRQLALAIGDFETGFGVTGSWLADDGTPSYNWGGLVGKGTAGSLRHGDITPEGSPTSYGFMAFRNMTEACRSFLKTWKRTDTMAAAEAGDALAVARAMCLHAYFGGVKGTADERAQVYGKGIFAKAQTIAATLGEPLYVGYDNSGSPPLVGDRCATAQRAEGELDAGPSWWAGLFLVGGLGAVAWWAWKRWWR